MNIFQKIRLLLDPYETIKDTVISMAKLSNSSDTHYYHYSDAKISIDLNCLNLKPYIAHIVVSIPSDRLVSGDIVFDSLFQKYREGDWIDYLMNLANKVRRNHKAQRKAKH